MVSEKIIRRSRIIAEHIAEIVSRNDHGERVGALQPMNANFREVVSAQERLLNAVERLLEKQPAQTVKRLPQRTNPIPSQATDFPLPVPCSSRARPSEAPMKKLNGHNAAVDTTATALPPQHPQSGEAVPPPLLKPPVSPKPTKDSEHPPLRPARGDDDLMSEEPSVPDRG